jgi:uncharacterized protein (TIGR03437 family)
MKLALFRPLATVVLAFTYPLAILADINSNATLNTGQNFNFDSGLVASSGGDIQFTGTSITFQGSAKGFNLGNLGSVEYGAINQTELGALQTAATTTPIAISQLVVGDIFAVLTNGGNGAKAMVTASSASSITFQFTTYESGTGSGPGAPTIAYILNNSSLIPTGFSNSGIAPSSIFKIHGTGMATPGTTPVLQTPTATTPIPSTFNGTSLSVTVNGTTVHPAIYYSSPTDVAAELPANTPTGSGTLTVTYNNTSVMSPITVVPSAFGIDVYDGNYAVAQDSVTGAIITPTNSAKPGQTITLWGTGLGADPGDSDTNYSNSPQKINTQVQVYIGSVQVPSIAYAGSLGYPGVNGVIFTVPSGIANECFNSIAVVTGGNVVSNIPVLSFNSTGGVCHDDYTGLTGTTISTLSGQTTVSSGSVFVVQLTSPGTSGTPTTNDIASASFQQVSGSGSVSAAGITSVGSCILNQLGLTSITGTTPTEIGLDAGTVTVTPPGGTAITLKTFPTLTGTYEAQLPPGSVPASGGTFSVAATGGTTSPTVGPFNTTINFPNPLLAWTNQSAAATVSRNAGLTYTWTSGASNSFVIMNGSSSSTATGLSASYTCIAPVSAGSFTVPAYILLGLPAGTGSSLIENSTAFTSFSATGLDYGTAFGAVSYSTNSTYQ